MTLRASDKLVIYSALALARGITLVSQARRAESAAGCMAGYASCPCD